MGVRFRFVDGVGLVDKFGFGKFMRIVGWKEGRGKAADTTKTLFFGVKEVEFIVEGDNTMFAVS